MYCIHSFHVSSTLPYRHRTVVHHQNCHKLNWYVLIFISAGELCLSMPPVPIEQSKCSAICVYPEFYSICRIDR